MDAHRSSVKIFRLKKAFCWICGNILSALTETGSVKCFVCQIKYRPEVYENMGFHYEICFNSRSDCKTSGKDSLRTSSDGDTTVSGPIVERKCVKCGIQKMSYATLQLRSTDEGQTVFYTCNRCGYKESENS